MRKTIRPIRCCVSCTRCFCIGNLTRSLRSLVRFLIRQQLVRKYRTPTLSMKYSLCTRICHCTPYIPLYPVYTIVPRIYHFTPYMPLYLVYTILPRIYHCTSYIPFYPVYAIVPRICHCTSYIPLYPVYLPLLCLQEKSPNCWLTADHYVGYVCHLLSYSNLFNEDQHTAGVSRTRSN